MIGHNGQFGRSVVYDVSNPVHPRLLCTISNTSARLLSGASFAYVDPRSAGRTDIVVHSFAGGGEQPAGVLPVWTADAAWSPNGALHAYTTRLEPSDSLPLGGLQVWLYEQGTSVPLFAYRTGIAGCMCRLGLPPPVLAFSPDGQYLVAGHNVGKGAEPLAVYRVSDRTRVATLNPSVTGAFWDRAGSRLFLARYTDLPQAWTPQSGVADLKATMGWSYRPGLSPDGLEIAYTAYADPSAMKDPRIYVYDVSSASSRMLVDKLRTQAVFVKNGWVWYLEERICDNSCLGGTEPTGRVLAMQLSSGTETEVSFAAGEKPDMLQFAFAPGEFWPQS